MLETLVTSHKKPFAPYVGGIRLLCCMYTDRGPSQICEMTAMVTN